MKGKQGNPYSHVTVRAAMAEDSNGSLQPQQQN